VSLFVFSGGERLVCPVTIPRRFVLPNRAMDFEIVFEGAGALKTRIGKKR
jgi:hypothetical protein